MDPGQLRRFIVRPALERIGMHSPAAEDLVMGTAAQESALRYVRQIRGPALGLFQVEPATYRDYWRGYLRRNRRVRDIILCDAGASRAPPPERVVYDLRFAAMMCRVHYRRIRAPLPERGDILGMAEYWKRYYNTVYGAGTVDEFMRSYLLVE